MHVLAMDDVFFLDGKSVSWKKAFREGRWVIPGPWLCCASGTGFGAAVTVVRNGQSGKLRIDYP